MIPHPDDTIVALATARGPGGRAILRITGPKAFDLASTVFQGHTPLAPRQMVPGILNLPSFSSPIPATCCGNRAPATYTGQDLVELHLLSSPPILDELTTALLNQGARSAQPGEFSLRGFLNGKRDLVQSEAVAAVIDARSTDELQQALSQLAGGVTSPLAGLREDLLNLLADLEAGLDFVDEDIEFVDHTQQLHRIAKAMAQVTLVQKKLADRTLSTDRFRVVFAGAPNAGKSSLFNALIGQNHAIVSEEAGTTRDYLVQPLTVDSEITVDLIDTAGRQDAETVIESAAQAHAMEQSRAAELVLWCVDRSELLTARPPADLEGRTTLPIATKCDEVDFVPAGWIATSAHTGTGLDRIRLEIADHARSYQSTGLTPSQSRCRHHVEICLSHLRKAHSLVLFEDPTELIALELRLALEQLGELVGAVYTEDLLDRIFSRFCIGK
ncbi:tRNA modification GTPase [Tuwongella immobilis]|uniref:tRNA modification GTPase MnmE n=1 Tax=Tuwongella immobilis TaxID=692036 RepID=A0A6C2YQ95_9BACT|nr:tRNA modification GTPase [Tuwongella immobilis]VIP03646.1 trna modification gtpase : tRNA modification GTPase MnmE OS=Singulisphaera acidiphila (strain ATCC BAA-1392 / DSM 18658 / VKM B-2454 / MOB10) GN=mnmE PE=3 SV=1: TrmE_N: MMR_HSR1: GTPase_Cys_C [Tuwongella immobilis]VTS04660.1 trna modification gtpase : tRNA modification GTPase MnmE OS=Singulisphaera acidiphila (strain ATCC BAA-1392 / DSM 18658 / VKM B-2454 / MOB10) GN=mnmE PE=3 SV=1: TrmE_N: MMR_HSR1: GTPase_Cys_C [Tuwongella immobilis]